MRILYVNQLKQMSGAEHSLLTLLQTMPAHVEALVACPAGPFADAVRDAGLPLRLISATDLSFRLHPVHTSRGLAEAVRAALRVRKLSRELDVDLVHANSTRAGLITGLAWRLGGRPSIVQVRDWVPDGPLARITLRALAAVSLAQVANSQYVADQLPQIGRGTVARVVPNPVDVNRFDPAQVDRGEARRALGLSPNDEVLLVAAHFTPWKGQDDAIRTLGLLRSKHPMARLLLVGSTKFGGARTRYDNDAYALGLRALVDRLGLAGQVHFLGERTDVPRVMRAADLLLVPSWKEAFGRVVTEAMAMELPVLATSEGGPAEILCGGIGGIVMTPQRPELWAEAVALLLDDPGRRREMGVSGRVRVLEKYTPERCTRLVLDVYERALAPGAH